MGGRADSAAYDTAISKINSASKHAAELRMHLEQIVLGPAFKGSQRSQSFLKHIVDRSLSGDFDSLRERSIGMELFGRPAAYDTSEDAVVRVTASDVRKRLLQHYAGAGAQSAFRIEIPSGSYLPEFRLPENQEPPAPPERVVIAAVPPSLPLPEPSTIEPPSAPPVQVAAEPRLLLRRRSAAVYAVLLLLAGSAVGIAIGRFSGKAPAPAEDLITAMYSGASGTMQVLVSDEGLVLAEVLMGRSCTLKEYEDLTCLNTPELQQDGLRRVRSFLAGRQIGNIGDIQNAVRINERLHARNWEVVVRHARQAHARDFRSGNFIILGGTFGNPWAGLFQFSDSNFPLEAPHPPGKPAAYLNPHAKPGEPASFGVEFGVDGGKTTTYARLTLVDNMSHNGRVLLVAGQSVSATELATDFLFHRESAAKTRQMLGIRPEGSIPNLEMILRVTERNQIGESVQLVACRKVIGQAD